LQDDITTIQTSTRREHRPPNRYTPHVPQQQQQQQQQQPHFVQHYTPSPNNQQAAWIQPSTTATYPFRSVGSYSDASA